MLLQFPFPVLETEPCASQIDGELFFSTEIFLSPIIAFIISLCMKCHFDMKNMYFQINYKEERGHDEFFEAGIFMWFLGLLLTFEGPGTVNAQYKYLRLYVAVHSTMFCVVIFKEPCYILNIGIYFCIY